MTQIGEILADVTIDRPVVRNYALDERLGFLVCREEIKPNEERLPPTISILGFCIPFHDRPLYFPRTVTPQTDFSKLSGTERYYDRINRGVGPRLYNTSQALRGTLEDYRQAGVYSVFIEESKLLDRRQPINSQIPGQINKRFKYKLKGAEALAHSVHKSYGNAQAVLYGKTPSSRRLQWERQVPSLPEMEPEFILIRSSQAILRKIGEYHKPSTSRDLDQ